MLTILSALLLPLACLTQLLLPEVILQPCGNVRGMVFWPCLDPLSPATQQSSEFSSITYSPLTKLEFPLPFVDFCFSFLEKVSHCMHPTVSITQRKAHSHSDWLHH